MPDRRDISQIEAGNISNQNAERRADIGYERSPTLTGMPSSLVLLSAF